MTTSSTNEGLAAGGGEMESSASQRWRGASTGNADKVDGVRRALQSNDEREFNFDMDLWNRFQFNSQHGNGFWKGLNGYLQSCEDPNSEVIEGVFLHHLTYD